MWEELSQTERNSSGNPRQTKPKNNTPSQIDPDVVYEFCPPREVPWLMTELRLNTRSLLYEPDQEDYDKLIALAYTFCRFGKIHPFLDGNGHVQRAVFAVMATEFDFPPVAPLRDSSAALRPPACGCPGNVRARVGRRGTGRARPCRRIPRLLPRWAVQCPAQAGRDGVAVLIGKALSRTRQDPGEGDQEEESRPRMPSSPAERPDAGDDPHHGVCLEEDEQGFDKRGTAERA